MSETEVMMKERCAVSDARCDSPRHVIDGSVFAMAHAVDKRSHLRRFLSHRGWYLDDATATLEC